jgi:lysophospholipase L1-like esterase
MKPIALRSVVLAAAVALAAGTAAAQVDVTYVALGDSLTAGVEGNCLVERNQVNSFPAVLARTGFLSDFEQPLVQELALTSPLVGNPCLGAVFVPPSTITVGNISQQGPPLNSLLARPYNNLGIPGAHVDDLVDITHANPNGTTAEQFAALVLRNVPGSPFDGTNAVTQANLLNPDLITLWVGSNDILPAALTGLFLPGVTVTPEAEFGQDYAQVLQSIAVPGRLIVAGNVPDITTIPFTTTVPSRLVIPGGSVAVLGPGNATYPCVPVAPDQGCPVPDGTLVTLPASSLLAQGIGVPVALGGTGRPLPDGAFVPPATVAPGVLLYPDEIAQIQEFTESYNDTIASQIAALGSNGVLVDINAIFHRIAEHGYEIGGIVLTKNFLSGGIFSADGFHPSTIGYMIVADEFIQGINTVMFWPRPDFSEVLFTPNVPPATSLRPPSSPPPPSGSGGGQYHYTLGMWKQLLTGTNAARGYALMMPGEGTTPARRTGPRVVSRD